MKTFAHKMYGVVLMSSFLFCLFILAPAQLLFANLEVQSFRPEFSMVRGTVWHGQSKSVSVSGASVGAWEYELHPWSVFALRPVIEWSIRNKANQAQGRVMVSLGEVLIEEATVESPLSAFRLPVQMAGQVKIALDQLSLMDFQCTLAEGSVTLAGRTIDGLQEQLDLSGPIVCEDGAVLAPLSGRFGAYPAKVDLIYHSDSSIEYSISLSVEDTLIGSNLAVLGFQKSGQIYELGGRMSLFP